MALEPSQFRQAIIENTLRSCQLFMGLPGSDTGVIASFVIPKHLDKGEYLFREGDRSEGFYIVQKGAINVHRVSAAGKEQVIHVFYPIESFAEATLATEGGYPADARATEPSLGYRHEIPEATEDPTIGNAMSNAACDIAEALGAAAMLVPTFTGKTASAVARLRPRRPIIGLSHHQWAIQQMAVEWGVTPRWIPETANVEELWDRSVESARESGLVQEGDTVVITAGTAVNIPGSTNVIKVDVV